MTDIDLEKLRTTIHNERTKLSATWLNGISVAMYAVGGFAPLSSSIYSNHGPGIVTAAGTLVCFLAATALHFLARKTLKGLKP
ncbi:amino acid transporter [Pararhizobium sp.]|uniref:amino acid transporter n=1 Tax=Pararhizobium sp. TaxID=1977563 RepID=UPI0027275D8C|nr:amino acid transporter [Pararhizobium sp.]MDO9417330.1 amino acid transporter [Pararhizobium sp.]